MPELEIWTTFEYKVCPPDAKIFKYTPYQFMIKAVPRFEIDRYTVHYHDLDYGYRRRMSALKQLVINPLCDWWTTNGLGKSVSLQWHSHQFTFLLLDPAHAALFKLTYGGEHLVQTDEHFAAEPDVG